MIINNQQTDENAGQGVKMLTTQRGTGGHPRCRVRLR